MERPIGVLDSGVGGLSVLTQMRKLLPHEDYLFFGDNGNAPYGEKTPDEILSLTCAAADRLLARNIKALVIACNTATSAAAEHIRAQLNIPVIGMEPALKPAQLLRHGGKVLVLATPATLALPKFIALMERYGQETYPVPVHGLVERIEAGEVEGPALEASLRAMLSPHLDGNVDALVLGCTHYIFARNAFANVVGEGVHLVDGNEGTARQLERRLAQDGLLRMHGKGSVELQTSGDEAVYLPLMRRLMEM